LISNKELSLTVIKADASDISSRDVGEDLLEAAIRGIPDLDTSRMSCDKSVEDRVVKDTEASIFV